MATGTDELNYMPTKEEFMDKLYSLHPIGNPDVMYAIMEDHLGKPLPDRKILTFELLIERYAAYCKYIKPFNDVKEKQYIKRDMLHKEIGAYLISKMYISDYSSMGGDPNDNYLFGI